MLNSSYYSGFKVCRLTIFPPHFHISLFLSFVCWFSSMVSRLSALSYLLLWEPIITLDTKLTMALAGCSGSCSANKWQMLSMEVPVFLATKPKILKRQRTVVSTLLSIFTDWRSENNDYELTLLRGSRLFSIYK